MKWYENEKKLKERWKRDILKRTTVNTKQKRRKDRICEIELQERFIKKRKLKS